MLFNYKSNISDRDILKYLRTQKVFRDSFTIYQALCKPTSNRAVFEGQLALLTAKNKILAVKIKDKFIYSIPEKLKTGKVLSGVLPSDAYLLLTGVVG